MLWELLEHSINEYYNSTFSDAQNTMTYRKMLQTVYEIADAFNRNFKSRLKVALLFNNQMMEGITLLSCYKTGLVPIPLSMNYGRKQCNKIIEATQADVILTDTPSYLG